MDNENKISFGEGVPGDVLAGQFGSVSVAPAAAPQLGFRIALPKAWIQASNVPMTPLAENGFSCAAIFMASNEISVQVLGTLIPYEVNLADWLEFEAHNRGFNLLDLQSGDTDCGQTIHAVARSNDGAYLRLLVVGKGPAVVLLLGRTPWDSPDSYKEVLGAAAASFEFTEPCRVKTREALQQFRDRDDLFQVLYPQSWPLETEDSLRPEKAGVNFRLTSESDTLAYLRVEADTRVALDEQGMEQMFKLVLSEVEESAVSITKLDPIPTGVPGPPERWLGECVLPSGVGQIALLLRASPFAWLSAVMLCPDKTANPWAWMRAKRAYEIAAAGLGPVMEASRNA